MKHLLFLPLSFLLLLHLFVDVVNLHHLANHFFIPLLLSRGGKVASLGFERDELYDFIAQILAVLLDILKELFFLGVELVVLLEFDAGDEYL